MGVRAVNGFQERIERMAPATGTNPLDPFPESGDSPLISVIIPNWNGAAHLPTCLDSLRRQTYPHFEVIVVDNGSTDNSLQLLERDYPEVKVVALPENRGFAGGVNAGIRQARGEIIAVFNNDAQADPRWLEELAAAPKTYSSRSNWPLSRCQTPRLPGTPSTP